MHDDRRSSKIRLFDPSINMARESLASSNDGAGFDSARPDPGLPSGAINEDDDEESGRDVDYYGDSPDDDDWSDRGNRFGHGEREEETETERVMDIGRAPSIDEPGTSGLVPVSSPSPDNS